MPNYKHDGHCLLCGTSQLALIDSVSTNRVIENYAKAYDVNVEHYFKSDAYLRLVACGTCGLLSYEPMPTGEGSFYEALQRLPWYYQDIKAEFHFAKMHVRDQDRVLEVGCGKGVFRTFLPNSVHYQGLEFNQTAIDKATMQGLHVTNEPIRNHADTHEGEYDVVCHFQVLEHISDPQEFLQACYKALKPGGKLIVAVPAEDSFLSICEGGWLNMPPHHVTRWKDHTLQYAFETQLSLAVEAIWHESVANYHQDWYRTILLNYARKSLIGMRIRLGQEVSLLDKIMRRITTLKTLQDWLFSKAEQKFKFSGRGHTVCIVGRKKAR